MKEGQIDERYNGGSKDGKPSNPKDAAANSRLDITLFPQTAIAYGALALTEGACKYGGFNYRLAGVNLSVYIAALNRHMMKFYNGEWEDDTTHVPHLASMLACVAIIIDGFERQNIIDDRPPSVDMSDLLSAFEKTVKHLQAIYPDGPKRVAEADGRVAPYAGYSPAPDRAVP
jgi:hypothetical protein